MVRPSNPLLMSVVLDAVGHLSDRKGSTVRDIIDFVRRNSKGSFRNLTMQVHRALKHAVNASLLRHRGGRYKILLSINPLSIQQSVEENSKSIDGFNDKLTNGSPERPTRGIKNSDRKRGNKQTRRKGIVNKSKESTNRWKRVETKEKVKLTKRGKRKTSGGNKNEENDDWAAPVRRKQQFSKRKINEIEDNNDLNSFSNDHSNEKISNCESDVSDDNSYEVKLTNSRNKFYSRERLSSLDRKRQEHKGQSTKNNRSRKRSSSRNRTQQRTNYNQNQNQQQQLEIEELPNDNTVDNDRMDCEQVSGNVEHMDMESTNPEVDRDLQP